MDKQANENMNETEMTDQVTVSEDVEPETEDFEVGDVITDIIKKLEAEVHRSFSLGRTSRLAAWRGLLKIYDDRDVLLKDQQRYLKSFPQYIYDTFKVSKSAAYSDAKVVEMLSTHGVKVLDSEHNDLIYMIRTIANAPEKMWTQLLKDIMKYDRDSLSEAIAKLRKGKTKKKESEIVEHAAMWEEVSTSFNPKKGSLRIEYTGESKENAKEYLKAIQRLLLHKDQKEVINLAEGLSDNVTAPISSDAKEPVPSPVSGPPVSSFNQKFVNRNPYEEDSKQGESLI
jgi:predicted CopG family antitoxin